jgi:Arylsulfotransferase (ASST)
MAFVQFSGVTYHDPDLAYGSYVLYTGADGITRLIDLNGAVRNEWPYPGVPARIIDSALNDGRIGDLGVQLTQLDDSPGGIYANRTVGQLSWTGEKLWEWGTEAPGGAARQNHDWELLENGNRLILVAIPREVAALGPHVVGDQGIYEVAPDGRIVWDWKAGDHLDEFGFTTEGFEYLRRSVARQPDNIWGYLEINSAKTLGPNRWHREDPDTVFAPDNILISSRKANIVALIDKSTGKIVWRLGPYFDAEPGSEHQRIKQSLAATSARPDLRPAQPTFHCRRASGRRQPAGVRQPGRCGLPACASWDLRRVAGPGDRPRHETHRVAVHRRGLGPPTVDVLQLICQQRAAPAQREHVDHRRHARPDLPGHPVRGGGLGVPHAVRGLCRRRRTRSQSSDGRRCRSADVDADDLPVAGRAFRLGACRHPPIAILVCKHSLSGRKRTELAVTAS